MYFLFSPYLVVSVFVAGVVGFSVAPLLNPVSPGAARAARIAAWSLVLGQAAVLATPFLGSLGGRLPLVGNLPALGAAVFWVALAAAAMKLLADAPANRGER